MSNEIKLRDEWMAEAKTQTLETLPAFIKKLHEYPHDYGTICHAIAAGAIGAAWAVERGPHGGITGFQAGCVMWCMIVGWGTVSESDMPQLRKLTDLLYPQYDQNWHELSKDTAAKLRDMARKNLESSPTAHPAVIARWQELADEKRPFPCGFVIRD